MNQPAVMIVCGDAYERRRIVEQLGQVLADGTIASYTKAGCVSEAAEAFVEAPWQFDLLVVDVHAPLEGNPEQNDESIIAVSTGEGGYIFINEHVLNRGYPPPPILLISRFDDFKQPDPHMNDLKISQLGIADFTALNLYRKLRKLGVATRLLLPPLFDEAKLEVELRFEEEPPEQYVRRKLESCLFENENSAQRLWELVSQLDDTLMRPDIRKKVFAKKNEKVLHRLNEWYQRVQSVLESKRQFGAPDSGEKSAEAQDWGAGYRDSGWFYMLRAEVTWTRQPVDSLLSLIKAMKFNVEADAEPMGNPGDPGYRVALRLHGDQKGVIRVHLMHWMRFLVPAKYRKRKRGYSEHIWHDVLRRQVAKAGRCLKRSPEALLKVEKQLADLSAQLQKKEHPTAAHELEARSCQIRQRRLRLRGKLAYWLLHLGCDYGNRPFRLFGWCLLIVVFFAYLYHPAGLATCSVDRLFSVHFTKWPYVANRFHNIITAIYFSVVTFVTLGYGDITPDNPLGRGLAMVEAALGFTMFGLFVAVASARLRPR